MAKFNRELKKYRLEFRTNRLIHSIRRYWVTCVGKKEVAPLLRDVHDVADTFHRKSFLIASDIVYSGLPRRKMLSHTFRDALHVQNTPTQLDPCN